MRIRHSHIPNIGVSNCIIDTGLKGLRVVLTANIHGDELTGLAVVHKLLDELPEKLVNGSVSLYPSLNPEGLSSMNRMHPMSSRDLNRCFSGRGVHGAAKHCKAIWDHICQFKPDLVLDLHTDSGDAIPYVIMDRILSGSRELEQKILQVANASGLAVLWEYSQPDYSRFNLHHSLTGAVVNQLGIPALTLEVGPRRFVHLSSVKKMKSSIFKIFSELGLIDQPIQDEITSPKLNAGDWRRSSGTAALCDGYWYPHLPVGTYVVEGDKIGVVLDSAGNICQTVRASHGGVVVAYPDKAAVMSGQACLTMAIPEN